MLSLLSACHSPRVDELDYFPPPTTKPSRRLSVQGSPSRKRRIEKLSIGSPTDFRHENHIDQNTADMWDADKWAGLARRPSLPAPPPPPPLQIPTEMSQQPASPTSPSQSRDGTAAPPPTPIVAPQKRKPIPAYLDETVTVSPFPTLSTPAATHPSIGSALRSPTAQSDAPAPPSKRRELVRLLDSLPEGSVTDDSAETHYVTKTTKARFDGAMQEIALALREGSQS